MKSELLEEYFIPLEASAVNIRKYQTSFWC